jgi:hypothetical protein
VHAYLDITGNLSKKKVVEEILYNLLIFGFSMVPRGGIEPSAGTLFKNICP